MKPLISLTTDFGEGNLGIGHMKGTIYDILSDVNIIDLTHKIPSYDLYRASRAIESVLYLPIGFHVCVVDPGVGTNRKAIIIKVKRGDYLIGPDNGVLISAAKNFLGGIEKIAEITNSSYMRKPISATFHGRDIFAAAAAHLSLGVNIEEFGEKIILKNILRPVYREAIVFSDTIEAKIIDINKFGGIHLNILHSAWNQFSLKIKEKIILHFNRNNKKIIMPFCNTYGEVAEKGTVILKDDYGRIEGAINKGNFAKKYGAYVNDECIIKKLPQQTSSD